MENINIRFVIFLVLLLNSLAVVVALMIYSDTGINNFKEDGFITQLSVFQLLMISWLSFKVFKARSVTRKGSFWRDSSVVWWVISLGFLYLAADEHFKFHERIDRQIHNVFNLQETGFTDRIDDLLVGLYGLVGIGVLIIYRNEWKIYKEARLFLICGFFFYLQWSYSTYSLIEMISLRYSSIWNGLSSYMDCSALLRTCLRSSRKGFFYWHFI